MKSHKKEYWLGIVASKAACLCLFSLSYLFLCETECCASPIQIIGEAQLQLINTVASTEDVVDTANFEIIVDGPRYRISCDYMGVQKLHYDVFSDGTDTFVINDHPSNINNGPKGPTAHAFAGRFPRMCPADIQAVWLGYCSSDFFNESTNDTNLAFSTEIIPWTLPEYVTNLIIYRSNTTLPQSIKGWSRNLVKLNDTASPERLGFYPNGFKVWRFESDTNSTDSIGGLPTNIELDAFIPKPKETATDGENTQPIRRIYFIAHSIRSYTNDFTPFPNLNIPHFKILDRRFEAVAGNHLVISEYSVSNGWPIGGSKGYENANTQAHQIVLDYGLSSKAGSPHARKLLIVIFLVINGALLFWIGKLVIKNKKQNK
jgi:hypothetical protein